MPLDAAAVNESDCALARETSQGRCNCGPSCEHLVSGDCLVIFYDLAGEPGISGFAGMSTDFGIEYSVCFIKYWQGVLGLYILAVYLFLSSSIILQGT